MAMSATLQERDEHSGFSLPIYCPVASRTSRSYLAEKHIVKDGVRDPRIVVRGRLRHAIPATPADLEAGGATSGVRRGEGTRARRSQRAQHSIRPIEHAPLRVPPGPTLGINPRREKSPALLLMVPTVSRPILLSAQSGDRASCNGMQKGQRSRTRRAETGFPCVPRGSSDHLLSSSCALLRPAAVRLAHVDRSCFGGRHSTLENLPWSPTLRGIP